MSFMVEGVPVSQGSMRAFPVKQKDGNVRAVVTHSKSEKLAVYRDDLRRAAREAGESMRQGPVGITIQFHFPHLKAHLKADGTVKDKAPSCKDTRPDVDKLVRAVLDALTGVCYVDDAQVFHVAAEKCYNVTPSTTVWLSGE